MVLALLAGLALALVLLPKARAWLAQRPWVSPPAPDAVRVYKHHGDARLSLHVYRARGANPDQPAPALLLFHGGGWQVGRAEQFHPQCHWLAARGLACISVGYRVATVHGTSPADALQDGRDAIRHVRRHARELGIDARRIAAGGGSAGGQIAAALGVGVPLADPGAESSIPTRPDALVLLNPMLDLSPGRPDHALVARYWQQVSPLHGLGPGSPPTLILTGDSDPEVPVATVRAYCNEARRHGGDCRAVVYPAAGHGFFNPQASGARFVLPVLEEIHAFFQGLGWLKDR